MPPTSITVIAVISLALGIVSALLVLLDIRLRGHRQAMPIMEAVWPITALYSGPLGLLAYARWGRSPRRGMPEAAQQQPRSRSFPVSVAIGASHCGAGCTLGDIIGATLVGLAGLEIAGLALWPELGVDYTLAFSIGIAFQYFAIAPMRGLGVRAGLVAALKADTLSLSAWEVGMFAWMILVQLVLFPRHLDPLQPTYWFMMQIAMLLGFATAYPVNWWLLRRGIKEAM